MFTVGYKVPLLCLSSRGIMEKKYDLSNTHIFLDRRFYLGEELVSKLSQSYELLTMFRSNRSIEAHVRVYIRNYHLNIF